MSELKVNNQVAPIPTIQTAACQKCGRQDETLRLVIYPFVFSIVVMTFRRAFTGLWCKAHRTQNQIIAGLISSIFGWFGIPFGIIYTPVALIQLARGGIQHPDVNIQILSSLAEEKLKSGDTANAIKCLEECLKFKDDPEIRKRLSQIRPHYGPEIETVGCLQTGLKLIGTLYLGLLIGTIIGIINYASGYFLSTVFGDEIQTFVAILGWSPFLVGTFIGGIGLARFVERTLLQIHSKSYGLATSLAVTASLFIVYGIFEGSVIADNVYSLTHGQFASIGEIIIVGLITLFAGGFVWIAVTLQSLDTSVFFLFLILMATIYFLVSTIWAARRIVDWQKRLLPEANI